MYRFLIVSSLILSTFQAGLAHDYWLKPWQSGAELVYGHQKESSEYKKSVVKSMKAYGPSGEPVVGEAVFFKDTFRLESPKAVAYAATVDDGPWVKTVRGWKRGTKKGQGKVVRSTWDYHYAKLVYGKGEALGLPLEIVIDQATDSVAGMVLFQGKPLAKAIIEVDHKKVTETDSQGRFLLKARIEQPLVLRVAHSVERSDNPDVDWSQHISTLTLKR